MLDAIAEGIADAMTALHDGTVAAVQLIGRLIGSAIEIASKAINETRSKALCEIRNLAKFSNFSFTFSIFIRIRDIFSLLF